MGRRIHLCPAIAIAGAITLGNSSVGAQDRQFTRTVDLQPSGTLRVEVDKGSISISSWDQPQVEIRARIDRPEEVGEDYAARAVEATVIEVTGDRYSVAVVSDYTNVPVHSGRNRWGNRTEPPVHYDIRAPRRLNLRVDSDRGPATVSGFEGTIDIVLDRGELELRDVAGDLRVEIDRGERSRMDGVRGSLRVDADRTNLDIDAHALDRDSRIEIDRGEVNLRVPEGQRLTVRTDISRRGSFHTDLPIQWMSSDPRRSEGHINGGGTELFVESDRATIELRRGALRR
jgi:hypothetical protein